MEKRIKELEDIIYRHELFIESFKGKIAELSAKKGSKKRAGEIQNQRKREIMRRAQELRKKGLTMSEAMKEAYKDESKASEKDENMESDDTDKEKEKFIAEMKERLEMEYELECLYRDAVKEEEENITEGIPHYDSFDYENLKKLVNQHDKIMIVVFSSTCPACEYYSTILDEVSTTEPSLTFGTITLDDGEEAKRLATLLNITTVPVVIVYKQGKEICRMIPELERGADIEKIKKIWKES